MSVLAPFESAPPTLFDPAGGESMLDEVLVGVWDARAADRRALQELRHDVALAAKLPAERADITHKRCGGEWGVSSAPAV